MINFQCVTIFLVSLIFGTSCFYTEKNENRSTVNVLGTEDSAMAKFKSIVLVRDNGFDLLHEALRDKVIASYTIACRDTEVADNDAAETYLSEVANVSLSDPNFKQKTTELKAAFKLKTAENMDNACELNEGIKASSNRLATYLREDREPWNKSVKAKESLSSYHKNVSKVFPFIQEGDLPYVVLDRGHGTATSGTIVSDTDDIGLVLIEDKMIAEDYATLKSGLSSDSDKQANADDSSPPPKCVDQAFLDDRAALYNNSSFLERYVKRPIPDFEKKLAEIYVKHKVRIANYSFGIASRGAIKRATEKNCAVLDYKAYYLALGAAERARDIYIEDSLYPDGKPYLEVRSAGNDGDQIDNLSDKRDCRDAKKLTIAVGSSTYKNKDKPTRSVFSNFGDCVDGFAYGAQIITPANDMFYDVVDGTSFSSPMVARFLALNAPIDADAKKLKEFFFASLDGSNKNVPDDLQNLNIVYDKKTGASLQNSTSTENQVLLQDNHSFRTANMINYRAMDRDLRFSSATK